MDQILEFITGLNTSSADKTLIAQIWENNLRQFDPYSERMLILKTALSCLGYRYAKSEDLFTDAIDCSTLVSQSYWEGALLSVPFTAERLRTAPDGEMIDTNELLPADVVIRYPDLSHSPDRTWNHVGLILGTYNHVTYVIESNTKNGCCITSLTDFKPEGGFKRYIRNSDIRITKAQFENLKLYAKRVPKLGRLGARQYCKSSSWGRIPHMGLDIYTPIGTPIKAPIDGVVVHAKISNEDGECTVIENNQLNIRCILGNVDGTLTENGQYIHKGDTIGTLVQPYQYSHIDYQTLNMEMCHLHLQVDGSLQIPFIPNKIKIVDSTFYNPLYLAKMGMIDLPLPV